MRDPQRHPEGENLTTRRTGCRQGMKLPMVAPHFVVLTNLPFGRREFNG